jgi:mono/diheme cytochrome c family protein
MNKIFLFLSICIIILISCSHNPYRQGHQLYTFHCENCHMADGSGLGTLIPSLRESPIVSKADGASLICLIRTGVPKDSLTNQLMPPNLVLNEVELANLANYLFHKHTKEERSVMVSEVKAWLTTCHIDQN